MSQLSISLVLVFGRNILLKMADGKNPAEVFDQYRRRLFGIAYRMLGTVADAEDVVQEAYLRWHKTNSESVESPEAWLVSVTTRLSIDRLRLLKKERENYIGPWLPEPLFADKIQTPEEELEFASNLSMAFIMLLEKLSPTERAAFLLREVFDISYAEIARIVGKNETACRQLIRRARERVRREKPRFEATDDDKRRLIEKFVRATRAGDEETLLSLFAEDALLTADGGGRVTAARKVVEGKRKIARLYSQLGKKGDASVITRIQPINGEFGVVTTGFGRLLAATVFEFDGGKICRVYQVMNPEKLKSLTAESARKNITS